MKNLLSALVLSIACSLSVIGQNNYTVSGYIYELGSDETLIGTYVFVPKLKVTAVANTYGFYSITLPESDSLELVFSMMGYQKQARQLSLHENISLDIHLERDIVKLDQVEISMDDYKYREKISDDVRSSVIEIPVGQVKDIPALLGEKDVLKTVQLMPGVQSGSEGSVGLYVRGGGPDQNLIILDDAVVYNAQHLFGFVSIFNGDALKSIELTKGGFPARYGGRLSSVLDINMKDGNKEEVKGEVGVGLISSRATLEGPIKKGKSSFLISGRRTYIDLLAKPFIPEGNSGGYYFYDFNAKVNHEFSRKDKIYFSTYSGQDKIYGGYKDYNSEEKFGIGWKNNTATTRWNHLFSDKLFANTSFIFSNYKFFVSADSKFDDDSFNLNYSSSIRDFAIKSDFDYHPNPKHHIKFGLISTLHRFRPSAIVVESSNDFEDELSTDTFYGLESGVYFEDTYSPIDRLKINIGMRVSSFNHADQTYFEPEPRVMLAYKINENLAWKASYASMNQYLHLISNTGISLPTDLWVPATDRISPQSSWQIATGLAKDFEKPRLTISLEGYYKKMNNILSYKEGASFLLIEEPEDSKAIDWESQVTSGIGWSYGMEFLVQKKIGKFTGWAGYTLSKTEQQFTELNAGKRFPARYDRRHDVSIVGIYKPDKKITLSATWVYGTGNAITLPLGEYSVVSPSGNDNYSFVENFSYYGERNSFRMAPYHRMDVSIQFHKELKKERSRTWEISIYNVYNRRNPYFYFVDVENRKTVLKQISLFPIIPSFSYTYKF